VPSHIPAVDRGLRNAFFGERGLVSLAELHRRAHQDAVAPAQQQLMLERGWIEVANRPAAGFATRRPEEPCATSASTVPWELGADNRPWLPNSSDGRSALSGHGPHPLAGCRVCEPVALCSVGDEYVRVVTEPVDDRRGERLWHQLVKAGRVNV
jgi:hypothetical protein